MSPSARISGAVRSSPRSILPASKRDWLRRARRSPSPSSTFGAREGKYGAGDCGGEHQLFPRQQVGALTLAVQAARAQLEKSRRDAAVVETDLSYALIRAPIA